MVNVRHFLQRVLVPSIFIAASSWSAADVSAVASLVVERQPAYQAQRMFAGRVLGGKRANIAFEFSGQVASIDVEDGDHVVEGQALAKLDTRALNIQRNELIAAKREVQARIEQLNRDLKRYQSLAKEGYVSDGHLDDIRSSLQATEAKQRQVEEQLRGVSLNLNKATLVAPFSGEVAGLQIEDGVIIEAGSPVLQLVELADNEAVFGVSGTLGDGLVLGQSLEVFGDFGTLPATLVSVSRNLDWRTQTRTVRVSLPTGSPVADGQTLYLLLPEVRDKAGFWLPKQALLEDVRGTWAVYQLVEAEPGDVYEVHKRSVRTLYQYKGKVYVEGELADGDLLVSAGTHKIAPGQTVRLARPQQASLSVVERNSDAQ